MIRRGLLLLSACSLLLLGADEPLTNSAWGMDDGQPWAAGIRGHDGRDVALYVSLFSFSSCACLGLIA